MIMHILDETKREFIGCGTMTLNNDIWYRDYDYETDDFDYFGILKGTYIVRVFRLFSGWEVREYLCDGVWDEIPRALSYNASVDMKINYIQHRKMHYNLATNF